MYNFGAKSEERLNQCHASLKVILRQAIKHMDFSITCGYRGEEEQTKAYETIDANGNRLSNAQYGESAHNFDISYAVDIVPYPVDWADMERFCYLGGLMKGIAHAHGIPLTWGYDWNNNGILVKDDPAESLKDAPHFELSNWKELRDG